MRVRVKDLRSRPIYKLRFPIYNLRSQFVLGFTFPSHFFRVPLLTVPPISVQGFEKGRDASNPLKNRNDKGQETHFLFRDGSRRHFFTRDSGVFSHLTCHGIKAILVCPCYKLGDLRLKKSECFLPLGNR